MSASFLARPFPASVPCALGFLPLRMHPYLRAVNLGGFCAADPRTEIIRHAPGGLRSSLFVFPRIHRVPPGASFLARPTGQCFNTPLLLSCQGRALELPASPASLRYQYGIHHNS